MTTVKILDDDNDDNRILRDGETMTVHMFAKDGSPLPGFTPVQRAIAATRDATRTFDAAMHKPGYIRDAGIGITDAAATARDAAYDEYSRRQADAWKSKAPPAGAYPEGSSSEGDPCTLNGSPGVLQAIDGHDGWLECVVTDGTNHAGDSRRPQLDAEAARKMRDAAFQEYDSEIQNRWRDK